MEYHLIGARSGTFGRVRARSGLLGARLVASLRSGVGSVARGIGALLTGLMFVYIMIA